ncbi:unnamed protein product [Caenorhabditis auriculariae]|uniref:C2H2-type domain-containing protein n=1 Tax=Caenorhabditis auriculariae TaxID=2777116 RepID=A0A8S1H1M5_9PELO|nr:unnamed protein product [Caenorhabditis auriculariae]
MDDYASMNYNYYPQGDMYQGAQMEDPMAQAPKPNDPPPPPPIVICPTEVDHINVTLEKNQQCACKDCGKLFNSVWYLKQHAVKHSNDRPFKCKFCFKTYKFRSNLYQHKCPDRQKSMAQAGKRGGHIISPSARRLETNQLLKSRIEANMHAEEMQSLQAGGGGGGTGVGACLSDNEDNDAPITYGLVIQNLDTSHQMTHNPIPMQLPPLPQQTDVHELENQQTELDSVRGQQLPPQQIEAFVQKNKNKLFSCRKCRVLFPTEESLLRHSASHSGEDLFAYKCNNCRQAFESEKELRRHALLHSGVGPWKCEECCGQFRSSVALRRHKDQCRPCFLPPVQNNIMVSVHSPFDPFSFIPTENDQMFIPMCDELNRQGTDSGLGSEGSPNSCANSSPERQNMSLEEVFDIIGDRKMEKEDDEDSGFRSRLNSVTHSGSPDSSSFSNHSGSPPRKLSGQDPEMSSPFMLASYGSGPAYGQQMFFDSPMSNSSYSIMDEMSTKQLMSLKGGAEDFQINACNFF